METKTKEQLIEELSNATRVSRVNDNFKSVSTKSVIENRDNITRYTIEYTTLSNSNRGMIIKEAHILEDNNTLNAVWQGESPQEILIDIRESQEQEQLQLNEIIMDLIGSKYNNIESKEYNPNSQIYKVVFIEGNTLFEVEGKVINNRLFEMSRLEFQEVN